MILMYGLQYLYSLLYLCQIDEWRCLDLIHYAVAGVELGRVINIAFSRK